MKIARVVDAVGNVVWASQEEDGRLLRVEGDPLAGPLTVVQEEVTPARWLPPIEPRAILCIGLNYRKHAEESGASMPEYPVLFMKNAAAAVGHGEPIHIPAVCQDEVDYEAELVVVIGTACRNATIENALDHVLGYTAANDVSARIWQNRLGGGQWIRGKSFDSFAPMGPLLVTTDEIADPGALAIRSELNGREMQSSNTNDLIFNVPALIAFLSQDTTLLPGTVILTGTPEGVGWFGDERVTMRPGDEIAVEIEGIGRLVNPVREAGP